LAEILGGVDAPGRGREGGRERRGETDGQSPKGAATLEPADDSRVGTG
jgi:hypothetical protein